ncbi:MAG: DUF1592 domain-containing protein [Planctomycetota bacterium]
MMFRLVSVAFPALLGWSLTCVSGEAIAEGQRPLAVARLIESACNGCHDDETDTGLNFDNLSDDLSDGHSFRVWRKVFDRVIANEMPPTTEARPDPAVVQKALTVLEARLLEADRARQAIEGRVPARRLTKREFGWSLRDLLSIAGDPANSLPEENASGRFDTIGANQRISDIHLSAYLSSAEEALSVALQLGANPYRDHRFDIPNSPRLAYHDGKDFANGGGIYRRVGDGVVLFTEVDFLLPSHAHGFDVPMPGRYRITIEADAFQSDASVVMKIICKSAGGGRMLASYDVQPGDPQTFQVTTELVPGDSFYPAFVMGEGTDWNYIVENGADDYTGRGLAIRSYRVEGPLFDHWPPPSTRDLLMGVKLERMRSIESQYPAALRQIVGQFAARAFRRPPSKTEVDAFVRLAERELDQGVSVVDGLRVALRGVLSSPQFMMFDATPGALTDHALATRLSYFLSRSTPDDQLLQLAGREALSDDGVLRSEVDRLIEHEHLQRFVADFLGQWLRLHKIHATAPDQRLYWEYDELLGNSMVKESEAFFTYLVKENLPVRNLIDSDFAFLNARLAAHYGISGVEGHHFRRVSLPAESVRGGILTHASVLKTTANGSVTSPVTRGNSVLSNFLGTPPPPPPPSAGSIEPDIRGTTTIREQLAAHRQLESCAVCHRKIDPPGFALEAFDPIGGHRTRYRALIDGKIEQGPQVDTSGVNEDGQPFSGIRDLKRLLLEHEEAFARNLISQLVVFSTGAEIQSADREHIDQILAATRENGFRLRDIIQTIVRSPLFQNL